MILSCYHSLNVYIFMLAGCSGINDCNISGLWSEDQVSDNISREASTTVS